MNQANENAGATAGPIDIASCDKPTYVRGAGAAAVLQVHGAAVSTQSVRMSMVLANVRGIFDAAVLRVFLAPPDGGAPAHDAHLGSCGLFGLRLASLPRADGAMGGLQCELDISSHSAQIDAALLLHGELHITILPHQALPDGVEISIDRIRICSQSFSATTTH